MSYTKKNLRETEDQAPGFGLGDIQEAHFPFDELGLKETGIGYQVLKAGNRSGIVHKHTAAEETYVILSGVGRMKIDDDVFDVAPLDAIRVDPAAARAFEAGDQDLEVLVFGPRDESDGEIIEGEYWGD